MRSTYCPYAALTSAATFGTSVPIAERNEYSISVIGTLTDPTSKRSTHSGARASSSCAGRARASESLLICDACPLRRLDEADDVAVCVLHGGDQLAPTDVPNVLLRFRTRVEKRLQAFLDVVNVPVADRGPHPLAVAMGIQTDILAFNVEADVVSLVHVGLYTHELAVQGLGLREVLHWVDDCPYT